ncbi:MAG TPA: hypothetical protein VH020_04140 [Stellaceae bacterium]|jgi:hypothetical protein|nr:hypothetical protein [Stellaceae bacterium]
MVEKLLGWGGIGVAVAVMLSALPAPADQPMTIDLTYDSVMDMVRPEAIPDVKVHHNLHLAVGADGGVSEHRNRNTDRYGDRNRSRQEELNDLPDEANYVSWRKAADGTLVREENDPQSVRTMIVTLLPGNTCRLEVADRLKPGFTEYEFLRIKTHTMGFYSNYRVFATSCRIR